MEKLSAFFHRIRANEDERQFVFRDLVLRSYLVRAYDTNEDGLLTSNDAGGEWFDVDSDTPPEKPLRAVVVRQLDGEATDSPYSLLVRVLGHFRKAANGLCAPDWDGIISHAYITKEFAKEWEEAAATIDSAPFGSAADDEEEQSVNTCPMAIASRIAQAMDSELTVAELSEYITNNAFINWNYWVAKMPVLTAAQAARLLAGLDPDVFESLDNRPNQNNCAPLCSRAKSMERSAVAQQQPPQSPAEWLEWADAHPFLVHDAFRVAVQSIAEMSHENEMPLPPDDLPNHFGYTIRGAAIAISREYEVPEQAMRDHIFKAAEKGELAVIDPQTGMPYTPKVRRDFYERIRIDDLNKWFKECGVAYRLEAGVTTNSTNTPQAITSGLGRKEILSIDWPLINGFNEDSLSRALSDVPNWLKPARIAKGAAGKGSALWNPAIVAACLLEKNYAKQAALTNLMRKSFPDWLEQWSQQQDE